MHDAPFTAYSLADVQRILSAKVDGSRLLDELYQDPTLDFFMLLGSFSGTAGNFHQSIYAAAAEFVAGLIHQRRLRGLVGSVIHPAQIHGVGLITRLDASVKEVLAKQLGPLILSERDMLEFVAEGILAGRPESGRQPELMGGYHVADPTQYPDLVWYLNPKLWWFIGNFSQSDSDGAAGLREEVQIKKQLLSANSPGKAAEIIADGFRAKMRSKLHLPDDFALPGSTLLTEVGVDSLVAVDLRIWFVKELAVDIPVMQLLGGSSIDTLAREATEKLEQKLVPLIERLPN
jgi:hypothetical protein